MALISKTIANLINGVSQQSPAIRNPSQCEVQENLISDTVLGLIHRPHSEFLCLMDNLGASPDIPYVHTLDNESGSRYQVVISNGDLKVFDLEGNEKTVNFPNGKAYLTASDPKNDFQCLTLGLTSYVLNKTQTVTQTKYSTLDRPENECLVFCKQGDYSTDYKVYVEGVVGTYSPAAAVSYGPDTITKTTSASTASDIKTTQIVADLDTGLQAGTVYGQGIFETEVSGSVIWMYTPDPPTSNDFYLFQVSVTDSKANNNLKLIRSQIQNFSDLPTVAPRNYVVQVIGDKSSGYDDYYVIFTPDDTGSDFGVGSWEETFGNDSNYMPTSSTMPWVLTDNEDGTFTFNQESWDARWAGDEVTNPAPSFIGGEIKGMFVFGNRLGFLTGDRVSLSEVGVYTNFFLTTVTTFLDSDPIDIKPLQGQGNWIYAVPLAEKIILFSEKGQAVFSGGNLLTPKTAVLESATQYPVSPLCEPKLIGDNIFFVASNGDYSRVYEYYIKTDTKSLRAADITAHCPQYIPSGITKLSGDDGSRFVFAMGCSETGTNDWYDLYVYRYFWIGDQKVQSSWSKWLFPIHQMLVSVSLIDNVLYLVSLNKVTGDLVFHKINLDVTQTENVATASTKTHLDFRIDGTDLVSVTGTGTRTFTLPFSIPPGHIDTLKVYRKENQTADPRVSWGVEVPIYSNNGTVSVGATTITIEDPDGDIGDDVWIGFNFRSVWTPSEIHLKDDQNGNQVPKEEGHLLLKRISFLYENSLYFRIEVTPTDKDTRTYVMTPYVIGDLTPVDEITSRSGRISVPVRAKNTKVSISIINDSVVPHRLQSAEWVGNYTIHSQRV